MDWQSATAGFRSVPSSTCNMSTEPADSKPRDFHDSTALIVVESTISSIDGPKASNSVLARAASVIVANVAINVEGLFGR